MLAETISIAVDAIMQMKAMIKICVMACSLLQPSTIPGAVGLSPVFCYLCYNGMHFPFDMTDFLRIDRDKFEDSIAVLGMDHTQRKEVRIYFENGGRKFEQIARDYGFEKAVLEEEE